MLPELFVKYEKIFRENGFSLYMVGGTSRDYLLGREFFDYDFVTDATPDNMLSFLPNIDLTFSRFGSIRIKGEPYEIDITTLREEGEYKDSRHPSFINYISDIEVDSKRRDFTINALYIDKDGKVYDFHNGLTDLKNGVIKFIGNPLTRIIEDPLRILRARRFSSTLNFKIDKETALIMEKNENLLALLNKDKINLELNKERKSK